MSLLPMMTHYAEPDTESSNKPKFTLLAGRYTNYYTISSGSTFCSVLFSLGMWHRKVTCFALRTSELPKRARQHKLLDMKAVGQVKKTVSLDLLVCHYRSGMSSKLAELRRLHPAVGTSLAVAALVAVAALKMFLLPRRARYRRFALACRN